MNCEKCQELLSDFLDGTLTGEDQWLFDKHLEDCFSCVGVREEMVAIVNVARESREQSVAPPNERALWLRIRNTLEIEFGTPTHAAAGAGKIDGSFAPATSRESFWSRFMNKRWELSLPQLATSVVAIAAAVSLLTALGVRGVTDPQPAPTTVTTADMQPRSKVPNRMQDGVMIGGYYSPGMASQVDIDYWNQRIEKRKANWNPRMRDAFERSMVVIEDAVNDSHGELARNPHDEVSEEMLNAALRDKMELLREFSEY